MINKNEGPAKILVETVETRIVDGLFYFELQSGEEKYGFAIPLGIAKALGPKMLSQVEKIEAKTGKKFDGGEAKETILSPWSPKK